MWSRNLLNVFVSPISATEYVCSLILISIIKLIISTLVMLVLARVLYSFNIFTMGMALVPLVLNLIIMGWSVGIITMSIIMRYGQEAEVLAWGIAFLFQPVSAVFYPVAVLPEPLRTISTFIPASHVFEGMRSVIAGNALPVSEIVWASGLNLCYITIAVLFFAWNFRTIKRKGLLVKVGE
jgi:ABC-2 type transport system permease protein